VNDAQGQVHARIYNEAEAIEKLARNMAEGLREVVIALSEVRAEIALLKVLILRNK
jgi:hypothetical protein